ncbi:MAG: cytochrome c4 [Proteobacteria bacterium]|nr:cytochrome c4 [Pseudomonadota bacterium]
MCVKRFRNRFILPLLALFATSAGTAAPPAVIEACKACHDVDGSGVGKPYVPIIAGTPPVHIEEALYAYKDGARQCTIEPVMCDTVALLSDDDIADLAEYYGKLPRYSHATTFNEELVARGEAVHRDLCARCHVPPDDPDVADVLGYPLHGQRADYLRYALKAYVDGTRENLLEEMEEKIGRLRHGDVEALVHYYVSY